MLDFRLTLLARDLDLVRAADAAGVDQIGLDLERLGKAARQRQDGARISSHDFDDLAAVFGALRRATPFVRLNPLHAGSPDEVERALAVGAGALMLPYFRSATEAVEFIGLARGRARVTLLVETGAALVRLHEIVALGGVDEIMIGLNDLHLELRLASHFELLGSELLAGVAAQVRRAGLRLGVGGVTCASDEGLPVPPDLVLAQYPRLDARSAWLARSFVRGGGDLAARVASLRARLAWWWAQPPDALHAAKLELRAKMSALPDRPDKLAVALRPISR